MTCIGLKTWVRLGLGAIALALPAGAAPGPITENVGGGHPAGWSGVLPTENAKRVLLTIDSGPLVAADGAEYAVVYDTIITVPGAAWLRLQFGDVHLGSHPARGNGSFLRITSLLDGGQQRLHAEHVRQWEHTSAYFNGDSVLVELLARPGVGPNRVVVESAIAGYGTGSSRTICGPDDDRVLSSDPRVARAGGGGCTYWLINDAQHTLLSAGHCTGPGMVAEFNVPLSNPDGSTVHASPDDQYVVAFSSMQVSFPTGAGNDWAYFACYPNSNTGLTPYEAQGDAFDLASLPPSTGATLRVTGYGVTSPPVPGEWNMVQKTHTGPYMGINPSNQLTYAVDTTDSNSGSPVIQESDGAAVGIHTHAGCSLSGGANAGTPLSNTELVHALANPRGRCAGPSDPVRNPPLAAMPDYRSAVVWLDRETGTFAQASSTWGVQVDGFAYDDTRRWAWISTSEPAIYAFEWDGRLFRVALPLTGVSRLRGLAFDPLTQTLYGYNQGRLYSVNQSTGLATQIGSVSAVNIAGIDFDPDTSTLYGIDNAAGAPSLVRIDTATGVVTSIGALGAGATQCPALAFDTSDGMLYTVDRPTAQLLRIDPATGAAVVVGTTGTSWPASFGMAAGREPCPGDVNGDGVISLADLSVLLSNFGVPWGATFNEGDVDLDGDVDLADLATLLSSFGLSCP